MDRTTSATTPLFALLVGINDYLCQGETLQPLRGAVNDVKEFESYLETYLSVPTDHIAVLTDAQATRGNIIQALQDLSKDEHIKKGDAILFYYAGHGIELDAPENWEAGGPNAKIQGIVPYDCGVHGTNPQTYVLPIPDRRLEYLLSEIAATKGDNITVILDCCHSASGTRELGKPHPISHKSENVDVRIRAATLAHALPHYRLEDLPAPHQEASSLSSLIPSILKPRGLASHVLIAACDRGEKAHEDDGHGRFSTALLKLLKSVSPNDLVYSDIVTQRNLGIIQGQTPYCEGLNNYRSLFNWKDLRIVHRKTFEVHYAPTSTRGEGRYTLNGGEIHNLTTNSEFSVYRKSDSELSNRLGVLHVDDSGLGPFTLTAKLAHGCTIFDTDIPTIAIPTTPEKHHHPHFHVPSGDDFHDLLQNLSENHSLKRLFDHSIPLVDNPHDAHAEITMNSDQKVTFKYTVDIAHGILSRKLNPIVAVLDPEPEDLARALSKFSHFYREVKFVNNNPELSRKIVVEFYKLQTVFERLEDRQWQERLDRCGPNLCIDGTVRLFMAKENSGEGLYGMKIINNWNQDLDVNVYRFNNDLSIRPCVESGACLSYRPHERLPLHHSGGSISIGYGAAGYPPMCFKMNDGLEKEVLFLKIYVATQAVNLSHISQESPFVSTRGMTHYQPKPKVTWTDIIVPVILCRSQTRSPVFHSRN